MKTNTEADVEPAPSCLADTGRRTICGPDVAPKTPDAEPSLQAGTRTTGDESWLKIST